MSPTLIRSMLLVLGASVVGSFGAVFLKLGSAKVGRNLLSFANPQLALGVFLYLGCAAAERLSGMSERSWRREAGVLLFISSSVCWM